ncbi:MAG: hypothetical protein IE881_09340 [Epsilonproteobacteria bacterium]|nr:hypothetical protein [Campylobacterota bacterium]
MTREQNARKNSVAREKRSKTLVISTITGLYADEFKKKNGAWNFIKIADHTHLTRQTVAKHIKQYENTRGSLFEDGYY